jgi:hypothetical protein
MPGNNNQLPTDKQQAIINKSLNKSLFVWWIPAHFRARARGWNDKGKRAESIRNAIEHLIIGF